MSITFLPFWASETIQRANNPMRGDFHTSLSDQTAISRGGSGPTNGAGDMLFKVLSTFRQDIILGLMRMDLRQANLSGEQFSSPMVEEGDGRRCGGRTKGSIRFVGYRDGNSVCVFGRKGSDEILIVERLHGGDCESFIAYLGGEAHGVRKAGLILLGIGLLLEFVWLGSRVPPHLARRQG
jgi:hypothetical protein